MDDLTKKRNLLNFGRIVVKTQDEPKQNLTFSEQEAKSIVIEAVLYFIFLFIFTLMIGLSRDTESAYLMREALEHLFITKEIPDYQIYKSFSTLVTVDEYYDWLRGPFLEGAFTDKFGDTVNTPLRQGYIFGVNRILGLVRFRQGRMPKDSCELRSEWDDSFGDRCIQGYKSSEVDTHSYGGLNDSTYTYWDVDKAGGSKVWGQLGMYASDGFVVDIQGTNYTYAYDVVESMIENEYIDLQTRIILIDFGVYNPQTNLYGDVRFILEFPMSGGIMTSSKIRMINLHRYDGARGGFVAVLEVTTYIFVGFWTINELREVMQAKQRALANRRCVDMLGFEGHRFLRAEDVVRMVNDKASVGKDKYREAIERLTDPVNLKSVTSLFPGSVVLYFNDWSNIFDCINLVLFYVSFSLRMMTIYATNSTEFEATRDTYVDIQPISEYYQMEQWCNASNAFLSWFKLFKYLRISQRMSQLIRTLSEGASEIGYFLIIFGIVFFSFAISGNVAFGVDVREFRTITQSCLVLFRGLTEGSIDFDRLYLTNRVLGPLYYAMFFILAFFVLMNMFLAIINQSYTTVQEDLKKRKGMDIMKIFWRALRKGASQRLQSLMGDLGKVVQPNLIPKPKAVIKEIDNLLLTARMADGWLDAEELAETILQSTGLAPNAALALSRRIIREHDQDNDGRLSIQEFAVIKDRVAEQLSEVKNRVKLSQQYQYVSKIETRLDSMLFRLRYASQLGEMLFLSDFVGGKDSALPPDPDKYRNAVVRLQSWARGTMVRKRFKRKRARQREALSGRTPILSPLSPRGTDRIDSPFAAAAVAASASASGYGSDRDLSHSLSAAADVFRENRERKKQDRIAALNLEASV